MLRIPFIRSLMLVALMSFAASSLFAANAQPWYKRWWGKIRESASSRFEDKKTSTISPPAAGTTDKKEVRSVSEIKEDKASLFVEERDKGLTEALQEQGGEEEKPYTGPDLSDEETTEERLLRRKFPIPRSSAPKPVQKPPTPDQYKTPHVPGDGN